MSTPSKKTTKTEVSKKAVARKSATVADDVPHKTETEKKKRNCKPPVPKSTLKREIAEQLKTYWMIGGENTLSDAEICNRIGITENQLLGWLKRGMRTKVVWNGEEQEMTLRQLRTRARAQLKGGYLARLNSLASKAEANGDILTASKIIMWLSEKQFPKEFGVLVGKGGENEGDTVKAVRLPFIPTSKP